VVEIASHLLGARLPQSLSSHMHTHVHMHAGGRGGNWMGERMADSTAGGALWQVSLLPGCMLALSVIELGFPTSVTRA